MLSEVFEKNSVFFYLNFFIGYEAPTLILVKHVEIADETRGKERKSFVFGGFARAGWSDELKYNGDSESYIFSLAPNFRSFYAYRGQGGTNYTYMNTKRIQGTKNKVGLGILLVMI